MSLLDDARLIIGRKGLKETMARALLHPGIQAIACYRVSHRLLLSGHGFLARVVWRIGYQLSGASIEPGAEIGPDFHMDHPQGTLIYRNTRIGAGCQVFSNCSVGAAHAPNVTKIRDGAIVYHGARVGGNMTIGEYARIGVNTTVVRRDIPPYATVVGNPGKVIVIEGRKVDPADYEHYAYDPADYHGPPQPGPDDLHLPDPPYCR